MKVLKKYSIFAVAAALLLLVAAGCGTLTNPTLSDNETSTTEGKGDTEPKAGPGPGPGSTEGKAEFEKICTACHGWDEPDFFTAEGANPAMKGQFTKHPKRDDWTATVGRMKTSGAQMSADEEKKIIGYLNANWSNKAPAAGGGEAAAGGGGDAGKAVFEKICTACHGWDEPDFFTAEGANPAMKGQFTKHPKRDDWTATVGRMKTSGAQMSADEEKQIIGYLNANWSNKAPAAEAAPAEGEAAPAATGGDAGKAAFEKICTACHGWDEPDFFTAEGANPAMKGQFTKHPKRADWAPTVGRMKTSGAQMTADEEKQITEYLNANWGG